MCPSSSLICKGACPRKILRKYGDIWKQFKKVIHKIKLGNLKMEKEDGF